MNTAPSNPGEKPVSRPQTAPSPEKLLAIAAISALVATGCKIDVSIGSSEEPATSATQEPKRPQPAQQVNGGVYVYNNVDVTTNINGQSITIKGDHQQVKIDSNFPLQRKDVVCQVDPANQTWNLVVTKMGTITTGNSFAYAPANGQPPKFYLNGKAFECKD